MIDYSAVVARMKARYKLRIRRWRKHMSGCAWRVTYHGGRRINWIEAPYPKTPISLAVFLHEVGHHAIGFHRYPAGSQEEYHAWLWAVNQMRRLGIEPTPAVQRRVDRSIRYAVRKDLRRSQPICAELRHYAAQAA